MKKTIATFQPPLSGSFGSLSGMISPIGWLLRGSYLQYVRSPAIVRGSKTVRFISFSGVNHNYARREDSTIFVILAVT